MRGIYIEGRSLNELPSFNEEADLTFLRRVARTINEAEQTSQRQVEEDRALSRQWRLGTVKNVGGLLMSGLVFVAGVGGAVYATVEASNNLTAPEVFDEKDIQLSGGTPIPIGSTGTPEYSFELLTHPELSGDKIPQVGDHGDSNSDETTQGHGLTIDDGHDRDSAIHLSEDGLRTFNMHVGHEGEKNCETVYVRFDTPNDIVRAWTIEEDRVNEFSVEVESDSITACWEGQEESADDDPDIVIKVETPEPGSR